MTTFDLPLDDGDVFAAETLLDYYKLSHRGQYPEGTACVYSTWTPRDSRIAGCRQAVVFGLQAAWARLHGLWARTFFQRPWSQVRDRYRRLVSATLGDPDPETAHLEALHGLGFLPVRVAALPEGMAVPVRFPVMTIENTDPRFHWLTNYLETALSCALWQASVSATRAWRLRLLLDDWAARTGTAPGFVPYQGHDFSFRGMGGFDAAAMSGMGHLLSFVGTDTVPAILAAEHWYGASAAAPGNAAFPCLGCSVPATEHSVQCMFEGDDEAYFRRMLALHPASVVSVVADGYDFWNVMGAVLPKLKPEIMARNGKLVVRPDSGDPVKIVCGDPDADDPLVRGGAVQALWDAFGGATNDAGFRELDPHVGLIYGDAIHYDRAKAILEGLARQGFASGNVVFGVGSYTYQLNTRDTLGYALKSTAAVVDGVEKAIFKSPKTDDGTKVSQRGRVRVFRDRHGALAWEDGLDRERSERDNLLQPFFEDGKLLRFETFAEIRERLRTQPAD